MATVSKWTPFGVALDLTATGSNVTRKSATQYTVSITASWETYYSGAQTNYGMTATSGGVTSTISAFDGTKRSSGSKTFTGTYSISGNGAATKSVTVTFKNFNTDNDDSASKSVSFNVSVPAWTSYTIQYNANGGSGAPGSQTKWKDQTLTLSSTKPTRTGYQFLGWSTSSTATSATYSAGGSYTANSEATLYAVWKANTYKVTYNANGGTGAPGAQTKTYGKTLTLSTTKPTRTNYNFKGWATSASATTATYSAGGNYTANAAVTLYAVWELAYKKPRITNVSVDRCDSDSTPNDEGMNALIKFDWETDEPMTSINVEWKQPSESKWTSETITVGPNIFDGIFDETGNISTDGSDVVSNKHKRTGYREVGSIFSDTIYITATDRAVDTYVYVHLYDKNKQQITYYNLPPTINGTIRTYSSMGVVYYRINANNGFDGRVYVSSVNPGTFEDVDYTCAKAMVGSINRVFGSNLLDTEHSYDIRITVNDGVGNSNISRVLSSMKLSLDFKPGGKGASVGKVSELEGVFDIGFKTRHLGGMLYPVLENGTDLNDLLTPNVYSGNNASSTSYGNCPITTGTFTLEVMSSGPSGQVYQRLTLCDKSKSTVYERFYYTSAWGEWYGGWIYPVLDSDFTMYGTSEADNKPRYRKNGNMVEVRGVVTPTVQLPKSGDNNTANYNIFTLPNGYRPNSPIYIIAQGSGNCTWLLRINTSGEVGFSRYRSGDTNANVSPGADGASGTWLPFQATFFIN